MELGMKDDAMESKENTDGLGGRLKATREAQSMLQDDLAQLVGTSKTSISHWERGRSKPGGELLLRLAKILNVDIGWLLLGVEPEKSSGFKGTPISKIPEVAMSDIGYNNIKTLCREAITAAFATVSVGPDAFATKVPGDSMASLANPRSLPEGSTVVIDPDLDPRSGDIVLIKPKVGQAMIKMLELAGSKTYYRSLNAAYPIEPAQKGDRIIGVAIECSRKLR